jgi:hypothetical protein
VGWPWDAHNGGVEAQKSPEGCELRPVVSDSKRYLNSKRQDQGLNQDQKIPYPAKKLHGPARSGSSRVIRCLNQSFNTTVCARLLVSFPERMMYGLHIALPNFSHCMTHAVVVCIMYSTYRAGCIPPASANYLFSSHPSANCRHSEKEALTIRGWLPSSQFCSNIRPADGAGSSTVHAIGSIFHPQMVLAPSQYMPLVQYSTHRWCWLHRRTCYWFNIPPTDGAGSIAVRTCHWFNIPPTDGADSITVHAISPIFHPQMVLAPSQNMLLV